jgi:hypothetical protein
MYTITNNLSQIFINNSEFVRILIQKIGRSSGERVNRSRNANRYHSPVVNNNKKNIID